MKINKQNIFSFIILIIMLGLITIMIVMLIPLLHHVLTDAHNETKMIDYIHAYGAKGVPVLIGLEALQVILTVIPAAAIQVLAGLCYGIVYGSMICIVGNIVGNMAVFIVLRQFRSTFAPFFKVRSDDPKKHKFLSVDTLNKSKHPEYIAFCFYLFPGIPNGILPYIFAQTKISIWKYLLSVSTASVPSVILCTLVGDRVSKGDFKTAIILAAILIVLILFIVIFRKRIIDTIERVFH